MKATIYYTVNELADRSGRPDGWIILLTNDDGDEVDLPASRPTYTTSEEAEAAALGIGASHA